MTLKDKEKLVRELVDTFKDRNELHEAYKKKMKGIILCVFSEFSRFAEEVGEDNINEESIANWIDNFVEERFKATP
jgi:hypothetical protein